MKTTKDTVVTNNPRHDLTFEEALEELFKPFIAYALNGYKEPE